MAAADEAVSGRHDAYGPGNARMSDVLKNVVPPMWLKVFGG